MVGDLLWVYEGLTEYLGDVLRRARRHLDSGGIPRTAGWRRRRLLTIARAVNGAICKDAATFAQVLYNAGGGWDNWRRGTDFYDEGELLWLDVDTHDPENDRRQEKPQ